MAMVVLMEAMKACRREQMNSITEFILNLCLRGGVSVQAEYSYYQYCPSRQQRVLSYKGDNATTANGRTVPYCTELYCTVLYPTVLHCIVLYCTVPYCIVQYRTVSYHTIPYYTVYRTLQTTTIPYESLHSLLAVL